MFCVPSDVLLTEQRRAADVNRAKFETQPPGDPALCAPQRPDPLPCNDCHVERTKVAQRRAETLLRILRCASLRVTPEVPRFEVVVLLIVTE